MVIEPAFGTFGSVGRCQVLLENEISISIKLVSRREGGREGKGSGVWLSMVTHTRNLSSAFNPSKCTLTAVEHTPGAVGSHVAAPGEQLGDRCLAQGSHLSRGIVEWREHLLFTPPPTIPAGPEIRTCNLWVTSPTL